MLNLRLRQLSIPEVIKEEPVDAMELLGAYIDFENSMKEFEKAKSREQSIENLEVLRDQIKVNGYSKDLDCLIGSSLKAIGIDTSAKPEQIAESLDTVIAKANGEPSTEAFGFVVAIAIGFLVGGLLGGTLVAFYVYCKAQHANNLELYKVIKDRPDDVLAKQLAERKMTTMSAKTFDKFGAGLIKLWSFLNSVIGEDGKINTDIDKIHGVLAPLGFNLMKDTGELPIDESSWYQGGTLYALGYTPASIKKLNDTMQSVYRAGEISQGLDKKLKVASKANVSEAKKVSKEEKVKARALAKAYANAAKAAMTLNKSMLVQWGRILKKLK